jgi:hypothetical protein
MYTVTQTGRESKARVMLETFEFDTYIYCSAWQTVHHVTTSPVKSRPG